MCDGQIRSSGDVSRPWHFLWRVGVEVWELTWCDIRGRTGGAGWKCYYAFSWVEARDTQDWTGTDYSFCTFSDSGLDLGFVLGRARYEPEAYRGCRPM